MMTSTSVVSAVPKLLSSELGEEAVILHLDRGLYFGLDDVGARIWQLIQQPIAVEEICARLTAEYEVEPARCERAVLQLLEELDGAELIRVTDGPAG